MASPSLFAVKGTTSGAPTTGAFTPNAAASGFRAWSNVPSGWIGLVRYEDGTAWELSWSYWNGTTLTRGSNQLFDSSTGSVLSLGSSATAALVVDGMELMSHLGDTPWRGVMAQAVSATAAVLGMTLAASGTGAAQSLASTSALHETPREQRTSSTTAGGQAGWATGLAGSPNAGFVSTAAGRGGVDFIARCGATTLPSGYRLMIGIIGGTGWSSNTEPSAYVASAAFFGKDSTDTNIQLMTNDGTSGSTKIDTGIPFATNAPFIFRIWIEPGSNKVWALLIRVDTGDICFKSTTTDVPLNGTALSGQMLGAISSTTAIVMQLTSLFVRHGF